MSHSREKWEEQIAKEFLEKSKNCWNSEILRNSEEISEDMPWQNACRIYKKKLVKNSKGIEIVVQLQKSLPEKFIKIWLETFFNKLRILKWIFEWIPEDFFGTSAGLLQEFLKKLPEWLSEDISEKKPCKLYWTELKKCHRHSLRHFQINF